MEVWDKVFERGEFSLLEPQPGVVELIPILEKRRAKRILDLGCGAGRHLILLAREGFEVYGVDISKIALKISENRLKSLGLKAELKKCSMENIDYPSEFFDAVICINVIYHTTRKGIIKALKEIYRLLKPGGLALITFISKRSWKYGLGEEVEKDTFIQREGSEAGIIHHYVDREELEELLKDFKILKIELREDVVEGKRRSHWTVLVEKPE